MITTGAANAAQNLVSIGLMTALRKRRAGPFLKKKRKRYGRWLPAYSEMEAHPNDDEQTGSNTAETRYP